ncbi:MAG: hypothetical protein IJY73_07420 [Oscillospiraceae bacterium]|nr:hypothetical protein [Oscillospiraceae bacterium]
MKKRKNYGRKIKRNKINLYPKRKTKAQKILGTVLLVIIILVIVFLGYCLGKPLLEFFEKSIGTNDKAPAWTPPADTTQAEEIPEGTTAAEVTTSAAETTSPVPVEDPDIYAVSVPVSALQNSASLSTFASKAAADGYTAAVVTLKNSSGHLLYYTEVSVAKDSEAVIGMMSASEICGILSQNGLVPIAEVSVLSDNKGGEINGDMCYKIVDEPTVSWLDYFSTGEPVRWSNPGNEATILYNKAIADELTASGFRKIIQTDIIFPPFQNYDREFIAAEYFAADRYKLLKNVVADGSCICVNAEDIINNMEGSAEVLKNKTELSGNTVIVRIRREAFTAEDRYPADAAALLEDIMSLCRTKCAGLELVPMIDKSGFSAEEIAAMKQTAASIGYSDLYIK